MEIYAWRIMSNHMYLIFRSTDGLKSEVLLSDFKRLTSRVLVKTIQENTRESRKEWSLAQFKEWGEQSSNVKHYQF
ncbi:hypothetical protein JCM21142_52312 [Saccharicrinis fermentans DSM 9555 = JCM 21142]|uniref:Transposase IS200-like domain-containing protein n=1 Tax=Saccharicrinis fermentans DSM 9555 = JCM 21142 TaxID=869213 RepID=W7Y7K7_9BACT|nr:hypothetical protein JCM21142_52312 [Saccharicrinis fermentans DSM 9555 = JCM 21142]